VDKERNIGWIRIAISYETAADLGLVNGGSKRPALRLRIAKCLNGLNVHAGAAFSTSHAEQTSVSDVPPTIEK
jgi:hypothetical protein